MSSNNTRVEIGKTVTGLSIVKVMRPGRGRPSFQVKISEGHYVPYKAWLKKNDQPVVPFKSHTVSEAKKDAEPKVTTKVTAKVGEAVA